MVYRGLLVRNMCDYSLFYVLKGISPLPYCKVLLEKDYLTGVHDRYKKSAFKKIWSLQEVELVDVGGM